MTLKWYFVKGLVVLSFPTSQGCRVVCQYGVAGQRREFFDLSRVKAEAPLALRALRQSMAVA
jgi:hypothetical protein